VNAPVNLQNALFARKVFAVREVLHERSYVRLPLSVGGKVSGFRSRDSIWLIPYRIPSFSGFVAERACSLHTSWTLTPVS
jgi:hypothetical protein